MGPALRWSIPWAAPAASEDLPSPWSRAPATRIATACENSEYGPNYSQQQGQADNSQGGTLTHQLIDNLGQRTDQTTWQGNNRVAVTQSPNGTLTQNNLDGTTITQTSSGVITQTNSDQSSVSYNPGSGTITQNDGQGTTTTFNSNGSVTQTSGPLSGLSTIWDTNGNGATISGLDGLGIPIPTPEPAPAAPPVPSSISLPQNPSGPAPSAPADDAPGGRTG